MTLRVAGRLARIALWLLACLPCFAIARAFGRGPFWVQFFLGRVGRVLGLRVRAEGQPVAGPVLYVANHISWLDILALGGATRARFIAKSDIAAWGLIGWLARIGGTVFVSRERRSETRIQADAVVIALGGRRPVALFAEGVTGDGRNVMPFKPPLFVAAIEAGAAVQPIAIDYGPHRADYAWPRALRFSAEMRRILDRPGRIPLTLRFLAPLDAAALDRKALAAQSQALIADALD